MCAARKEKINKSEPRRTGDEIEVLVRTDKPLSAQQQDELKGVGYHTRFVMGNFSSGSVSDVEHLDKVAELPFVRKIERSFPMYQE